MRRGRLNNKNQAKLTSKHLRTLENLTDAKVTDNDIDLKIILPLVGPIIENSGEDLTDQCVLCQNFMTEKDQAISKKLVKFSADRGDIQKILMRLKQRLQMKVEAGQQINIKNFDELD